MARRSRAIGWSWSRRAASALAGAACAGLLAAGCASEDEGTSAPVRLAAWSFPADVAIPQVPQPPPAADPAPKPERDRSGDQIEGGFEITGEDGASAVSPGAPSDAEIRAQLRELYGDDAVATGSADGGGGLSRSVALHGGLADAPPDAPPAVQRIVAAANQVAKLPYVYGGGHGRGAEGLFVDTAYDCSGSISFALANAGLVDAPMTSGQMMSWGEPGQGEWVTIYANEGHAFMVVGGARFDTVGLRETGSRWQRPFRTVSGFTAVHPPGL